MTVVLGAGRLPNPVLLVGEAPGKDEAKRGRPFVGKAGREQEWYLRRHRLSSSLWYKTNVVKEYRKGNPDPTPSQIREWSPVLESEIAECRPDLIVAVGRFAARWFLGDSVDLEMVHGLPHRAGAFDPSRSGRAGSAIVLPIYHPALGFYDNDARSIIDWDYQQVAAVIEKIGRGETVEVVEDTTRERLYLDVSGKEFSAIVDSLPSDTVLGLDTEGSPDNPWCLQISDREGCGYALRYSRPDFDLGISALRRIADRGALFVIHNAMFDLEMCRRMGLDLFHARVWDSMYAAYLLRIEPQGLKPLAWRWCGMRMRQYFDVVGDAGAEKQVDYLCEVVSRIWPKPEPRAVLSNDGTAKMYTPWSIERRARKILEDWGGDSEETDIGSRWASLDQDLKEIVEREIGPMPVGTLEDVPLTESIDYSVRDSDAARRLYFRLSEKLEELDLTRTMNDCMEVLPVFEEMQSTGMSASRSYFESLHNEMTEEFHKYVSRLSHNFFDDRPFNPNSRPQVATLLRRRGLQAAKRTPSGDVSTSKSSIEHLRYTDEAISLVFDARERAHIRDSFCQPVLDRTDPDGPDIQPVRCKIKTTRTATRRLATTDPNLLAIPVRSSLGRRVREGYQCGEGEVYGAWDLSQVEMRFMAHESKDERLCSAFREGRDIHSETVSTIFGIPLEEVDKEDIETRIPAKTAGFGVLYGIQGEGLLAQLRTLGLEEWDVERCEGLIEGWLDTYPGVRDYIHRTKKEVEKVGWVRDHWGMYRHLPGIWSDEGKIRAEAGRIAVSHRIQGGAQGMIQRSMAWLKPIIRSMQEGGLNVHWCLQIHDEIVMRFSEELWEVLNPLVVEALTEHCGVELRVPVKAEGHMAKTWGGLK